MQEPSIQHDHMYKVEFRTPRGWLKMYTYASATEEALEKAKQRVEDNAKQGIILNVLEWGVPEVV